MSNVSNIIVVLQEKLKTSENSLELATYSKMIEKLQLNAVDVVLTYADLPIQSDNGNIILVENEQELYYNVSNVWYSLGSIVTNVGYSWGNNSFGQLGNGVFKGDNAQSPVTIVAHNNWSQLSAGGRHSLGIANGIAYAWGCNINGQLGSGVNIFYNFPVTVVGGITNWSQISAKNLSSMGIANGIAYGWGTLGYGRIGNNANTGNQFSPVTVVGGITNWSQVSLGVTHGLGIAGGIAYAWGNNVSGRLGDDTVINKSSPVTVVGGITNWSQVSAGDRHNIGIANGIAYAWGSSSAGALGNDVGLTAQSSPVTVVGGIADWSQVSAMQSHSLGIAGGIAYAWGASTNGRLGDGTVIGRSSPVTVVGGITNWSQVSAGENHSLGLTDTGVLYAWGSNTNFQLGDGTSTSRSSPVTVVGGITNWSSVSAGVNFGLAVAANVSKEFTQS
jgi:alpha-tubulin suppressor-like RCC1 family protein